MSMANRGARYIITGTAGGAIKAFRDTEKAALGAGERLEATGNKLTKVGSGMESFGHKMAALSVPLLAVGGYSVKMALDFQKSMTQVRTQTGATGKEVSYFSKELLKMGNTGFDATELAQGLFRVASDGFKGAEALKVLKAAAMGAAISGADLEQTTNALGGALRTHLKDVHSAADAMNILDSTVGLGKFRFEELNAALSSGFLVQAKRTGIGLGEIGNALDALARKGVPPEEEATRLQKTLIQFSAVTGVAKTALHSIGIGQFQLAEDMKKHGLIFALQDLRKHLGAINEYKGNAIIAEAFGRSKGAGNVGALLESLPEMEKIAKEREKYGTIQHQLAITEQQDYYKIKTGIAQLKNTLIQLGSALLPVVVPAFKKLAEWAEKTATWFRKLPAPIKDITIGFTAFLAIGGPMLIFFGKLISTIGSTITLFGKLAPAMEAEAGASLSAGRLLGTSFLTGFGGIVTAAAVGAVIYEFLKNTNKERPLEEAFDTIFGGHNKFERDAAKREADERKRFLGQPGIKKEQAIARHLSGPRREANQEVNQILNRITREELAGYNAAHPHYDRNHPPPPIVIHLHVDGKKMAMVTAEHIRNTPSIAKPVAEGVTKSAQFKAAH